MTMLLLRFPHQVARLFVLVVLCGAALGARAQDDKNGQAKDTPYAIPEMPALTFMGASANAIKRPVTPRALATELVNGIDSAGRVKQGLAVAISPYAMTGGSVTRNEYQTNWLKYVLYNAQLSAGSIRTAGDANATDVGVGLRLVLLDKSDPMRDPAHTSQVEKILLESLPLQPGEPDIPSDTKQKILKARTEWKKKHWNQAGLSVAAAGGWRLTDSRVQPSPDNRWLGWSTWATGALPLAGTAGQLVGQMRYTAQQQTAGSDQPTTTDHQLHYGARVIFGSATVNFFGEVNGIRRSNPLPNLDKTRADWAGGIEFRASDGVWIATSLGRKLPDNAKAEAVLLFAGLRWQLASGAGFK